MVALLMGLALVSCKEKALVEETVVITDSVEISKRMDAFVAAYEQNKFKLYTTANCDTAFTDISKELGQKEVIQIPDMMYPGEFKDSMITNLFSFDGVEKIQIVEAKNAKGSVQHYTSYKVLYPVITSGNMGVAPTELFYANPKEISSGLLTQ